MNKSHFRWALALTAGSVGFAVCLPIYGIGLTQTLIKSSDAHEAAVAALTSSEVVRADVGDPAESRGFVIGDVSTTASGGKADLTIPIEGPRGKGRGQVRLSKSGGRWFVDEAGWSFANRVTILVEPAPSYALTY